MPRNGSGVYTAPQNSWNPAVNGAGAQPADWMAILQDLVAAMTQSTSADGQTLITGVWNFGNNRITGVGAPIGTGNALRWEQMIKGADIASAATISIPNEGALFDVTGTTTITSIDDAYPGRCVLLRFNDAVTLTNSASLRLPGGQTRTTYTGDILTAVNTDTSEWEVINWASSGGIEWLSKPIGEPFPLRDDLDGVAIPPTDHPGFRYIKLTAGDTYNDGVLTSESVTGSAPLVVATAVIDLPDSPMDGETVNLWNTERRIPRPGSPGTLENDALQGHRHLPNGGGNFVVNRGGTAAAYGTSTVSGFTLATEGSTSNASESIYGAVRADVETRMKNQGVNYYMRIK